MTHAVLDEAAAAGTAFPEEDEDCHIKILLYDRSVYHWLEWWASYSSVKHPVDNYMVLLITCLSLLSFETT